MATCLGRLGDAVAAPAREEIPELTEIRESKGPARVLARRVRRGLLPKSRVVLPGWGRMRNACHVDLPVGTFTVPTCLGAAPALPFIDMANGQILGTHPEQGVERVAQRSPRASRLDFEQNA